MALAKNVALDSGIEATYHVVSALYIYPEKPSVHINVESFLSKEMKDAGKSPLLTYQFEFADTEYPFAESISIEKAYEAVMTRDMFSDATIVE